MKNVIEAWTSLADAAQGRDVEALRTAKNAAIESCVKYLSHVTSDVEFVEQVVKLGEGIQAIASRYPDGVANVVMEARSMLSAIAFRTLQDRHLPDELHGVLDDQAVLKWVSQGDQQAMKQVLDAHRHLQTTVAPLVIRGRKVLQGAKAGHAAVHGTADDREQRYVKWQAEIDRRMRENPSLSLTAARRRVAKQFQVSFGTVKTHTKKPAK